MASDARTRRRPLVRGVGRLAAALLMVALTGCGEDVAETGTSAGGDRGDAASSSAPVHVALAIVEEIEVRETVIATGTVAAKQTSNIGPLVGGVIEKIYVRVGDRVAKGAPLFQTRPNIYERELREAEADVELAQAKLVQAQRNYDRAKELARRGTVSQARLDDAETSLRVAEAAMHRQEASADTARQKYEDTVVRAPFDGVITERYTNEGVFLTNVFRGGSDSTVVEIQEVYIVGAIVRAPEAKLPLLRLDLAAKLYVEGFETPFTSSVLILNDKVDVRTRTVELRLPIANPDYAVKPGQFVRAEIITDPKSVLVVPRKALLGTALNQYVFISADGVAQRRVVTVEELDADRVRILTGLTAGENVVLPGEVEIHDGDRVSAGAQHAAG